MGNVEYVECYAELANAIVLQAFKDYRKALFMNRGQGGGSALST